MSGVRAGFNRRGQPQRRFAERSPKLGFVGYFVQLQFWNDSAALAIEHLLQIERKRIGIAAARHHLQRRGKLNQHVVISVSRHGLHAMF